MCLFGIQYIVKLGHFGTTELENLNAEYGIGVTNKLCGCFLQTIVIQLVGQGFFLAIATISSW